MTSGDAAGAPQRCPLCGKGVRGPERTVTQISIRCANTPDCGVALHTNIRRHESDEMAAARAVTAWNRRASSRSTSLPSGGRSEERQKLPTEEMIAAGMAAWGRIASGGKPEFAPPLTGQLGAETRVLVTAILSDALASHIRSEP